LKRRATKFDRNHPHWQQIVGFARLVGSSFVGSYATGWLDGATGSPDVCYLLMAGALLASGVITLAASGEHGRVPAVATTLSPHP
jgi:hypothetical protein